jgi:hypothetical protein
MPHDICVFNKARPINTKGQEDHRVPSGDSAVEETKVHRDLWISITRHQASSEEVTFSSK